MDLALNEDVSLAMALTYSPILSCSSASRCLDAESLRSCLQRRGEGCDSDADDIYYHVRGKYGGDSNEDTDDMISDTRWVKLTELVTNMGESELAELDVWAGQLQKAAKAVRKRIRRAQEGGE